jgi:hypothetical protein
MRRPLATTRFFNELGRRVAYFYIRQLMRSDVEWETDLPLGAKSTDRPGRHCAGLAFRHRAAIAAIRGNGEGTVVLARSV